ncbi:MAG: phosphatidylglycerophosphatase A [bacterium]|nr:phosphatidylglycerophosphatase A [bacterium]
MNFLVKLVGSFLFTGYFPFAPATFASLVFSLIYLFVPGGEWLANPWVLLGTLIVSIPVSTRLEKQYGKDPSVAVIDEVVGMQVVLVLAEPTLVGVALGFFLFRVFDVLKPPPVARSQTLPGGWGIVIDDFLAGIYTRIVMILIALLFPVVGRFL